MRPPPPLRVRRKSPIKGAPRCFGKREQTAKSLGGHIVIQLRRNNGTAPAPAPSQSEQSECRGGRALLKGRDRYMQRWLVRLCSEGPPVRTLCSEGSDGGQKGRLESRGWQDGLLLCGRVVPAPPALADADPSRFGVPFAVDLAFSDGEVHRRREMGEASAAAGARHHRAHGVAFGTTPRAFGLYSPRREPFASKGWGVVQELPAGLRGGPCPRYPRPAPPRERW